MARFSATLILATSLAQAAFDNSRHDNLAVYWGQNSYGATHSDTANYQKTLSYYCNDANVDVFPIAFITNFDSTGGQPVMNLANICNNVDNATFPGTSLPNCQALASDITGCQAKGKMLTVSLGGANTNNVLASDQAASDFADVLWNDFLGGSSNTRPFGSAVLDGVDIDVESGAPNEHFPALVNRLRSHFSGASKKYYISAAPQCPYPDSNLQDALNGANFDIVFLQTYNNQCGLQSFGTTNWNFGLWDYWARNISPNKDVKIYVGAPASSTAGGNYVDSATLSNILQATRKAFPSFGGAFLWDASQAWMNGNYQDAVKAALKAGGGTGYTFPTCNTACKTGSVYTQGQQCSYQGYIWQAKWWTQATPTFSSNSDWMPMSACAGGGATTITTSPDTTATQTPGNTTVCNGVAAWSAGTVYTSPQQATYNNHLWTAKWWTQGDAPGGSAGAWNDDGACAVSASKRFVAAVQTAAPLLQRAFNEDKSSGDDRRDILEGSYWRAGLGRRAGAMGRMFEWN